MSGRTTPKTPTFAEEVTIRTFSPIPPEDDQEGYAVVNHTTSDKVFKFSQQISRLDDALRGLDLFDVENLTLKEFNIAMLPLISRAESDPITANDAKLSHDESELFKVLGERKKELSALKKAKISELQKKVSKAIEERLEKPRVLSPSSSSRSSTPDLDSLAEE